MSLNQLYAAALEGEPLLIRLDASARVERDLTALAAFLASDPIGRNVIAGVSGDTNDDDFWPDDQDSYLAYIRPYKVSGGTLSIPVRGVLLANFPYAAGGYATGYQYIERAFSRGMNDPNVQRIALAIDSPGGMVSGCFDCTDAMAADKRKPVRAFAADSAYSAAYAIASVGDKIVVTRTGGVGSIGVVTAHVDYSDALKKEGIKVTFISSPKGGYKTEGNPYEPLSAEAEARIQARIDSLYDVFVSTVATNRNMSADDVRATQALCFSAEDAVSNGLADSISRLDKGLAAFAAETSTTGVRNMAKTFTQEEHDEAMASIKVIAHGAGMVDGRAVERARIVAIMTCAEAEKRPIAARMAALETSMTAEEASAFLKKIPEEKAAGPTPEEARAAAFTAAMSGGNPNLHATGAGAEGGETDAQRIVRNFKAAGGRVREQATH